MRLSYWWFDWRHRHQPSADLRIKQFKALPVIQDAERMTTKRQAEPHRLPVPLTIDEWKQRYGRTA